MTIKEIEQSYTDARNKFSKMYEERLIEILKNAGVYEKKVLFLNDGSALNPKTANVPGVLKIYPEGFGSIAWTVKFVPFKKDGSTSMNVRNLYIGSPLDEEDFTKRLLGCVKIIED